MKTMNVKAYRSNIEFTFNDDRESITLYSDDYLSSDEKFTESEMREWLKDCYTLSEEETDTIIETLLIHDWIEK